MRIIKWPKWYIGLSIVFIVLFFIYNYRSPSIIRREKFSIDVLLAINGIVIKKYVDNKQHNHKTCLYIENSDTIKLLLDFDTSGLFNYIIEGDSIIKKSGDPKILVKRNNISNSFVLKYD